MTLDITRNAGQVTQVEQARAVAEVAASVLAAQQSPRDEDLAIARFKRSCARLDFAQRAMFSFPKGGNNKRVTGPTIHFAIEAARCWGNMTSGSAEIERGSDSSTIVAFAWDMETNFARRTTFVSPHSGYTDAPEIGEDGKPRPARKLIAVRDVRENNQSAGSRVEREQILAALPSWFVEMGKRLCAETVAGQGGGKPIEDRRRQMVERFEGIGVRREELVRRIGAPVDQWIELDLATLTVIGQAITNGERTIEEEFGRRPGAAPATTVTGEDLAGAGPVDAQPVDTPADEPAAEEDPQAPASEETMRALAARMAALGLAGRGQAAKDRRHRLLMALLDRAVDDTQNVTVEQAAGVQEWLDAATPEAVAALLDEQAPGGDR